MSNNATRAGLVKTGDKDEGRDVFIGTKEQWEAYEEMIENEVNRELEEQANLNAYWDEMRGDLEELERDNYLDK